MLRLQHPSPRADLILQRFEAGERAVDIARDIGVSRQRVDQVLAKAGLRSYRPRVCFACHREMRPKTGIKASIWWPGLCVGCGAEARYIYTRCSWCGAWHRKNLKDFLWMRSHPHSVTGVPYQKAFCNGSCRARHNVTVREARRRARKVSA